MAHHIHFRNLLHSNKLDAFREWVQTQGYVVHPTPNPEKNIYECLRIELYDRAGNNPHLVFYKRLNTVHISIPEASYPLVREFIDQTQSPASKKRAANKKRRRQKEHNMARKNKHLLQPKKNNRPSYDKIREVLNTVDAMDLPDGAYWAMVHELLNLEYGDVFPLMEEYGILG